MTRTDTDAAAAWSRSLSALFGEGMFAAVGARRRDDRRLDALDVMRLTTGDPRGWSRRISAAGVLPGRFGADAVLFTDAVTARTDPHVDMFHRDGVYEGFTGHVMDCGVIAVSATEVGVFRAFSTD
ncbi:hypothetical protein [Streptomyces sp. V2I9]|uniref:hypothetical protein n=1 Tax=Streptomyces sp. V2I9 TaxID=3042304 RepID=UPI00277D60EC|nr:hypothetical protein [Streptomyces sp. V2I9]MDQ0986199.1 uncharacterized protein (DUF58 family) [Streptomyces sp. V2I9]